MNIGNLYVHICIKYFFPLGGVIFLLNSALMNNLESFNYNQCK